jgi:hypothetical protein
MEYAHLDPASQRQLLGQRLAQLEAQHLEASLNLQTHERQRAADPRLASHEGVAHWADEVQRLEIAIEVNRGALSAIAGD